MLEQPVKKKAQKLNEAKKTFLRQGERYGIVNFDYRKVCEDLSCLLSKKYVSNFFRDKRRGN